MPKRAPLVPGQRFGRLVVVGAGTHRTNPQGDTIYHAKVKCDCGTQKSVAELSLKAGMTRSCGCLQREWARNSRATKIIDVPGGTVFGHLTVIEEAPKRNGERAFVVQCHCGAKSIALFCNLRAGKTTTCGCGQRASNLKHGQWRSATYRSWTKMVDRCTSSDPKHIKDYQARGIGIDPRWREFENFLADMGERPPGATIERIDNNRGYAKDNCRWASRAEQMRNTRRTKFVLLNGKKLCVTDAALRIGVPRNRIWWRARTKAETLQQAIDHYAAKRTTAASRCAPPVADTPPAQ